MDSASSTIVLCTIFGCKLDVTSSQQEKTLGLMVTQGLIKFVGKINGGRESLSLGAEDIQYVVDNISPDGYYAPHYVPVSKTDPFSRETGDSQWLDIYWRISMLITTLNNLRGDRLGFFIDKHLKPIQGPKMAAFGELLREIITKKIATHLVSVEAAASQYQLIYRTLCGAGDTGLLDKVDLHNIFDQMRARKGDMVVTGSMKCILLLLVNNHLRRRSMAQQRLLSLRKVLWILKLPFADDILKGLPPNFWTVKKKDIQLLGTRRKIFDYCGTTLENHTFLAAIMPPTPMDEELFISEDVKNAAYAPRIGPLLRASGEPHEGKSTMERYFPGISVPNPSVNKQISVEFEQGIGVSCDIVKQLFRISSNTRKQTLLWFHQVATITERRQTLNLASNERNLANVPPTEVGLMERITNTMNSLCSFNLSLGVTAVLLRLIEKVKPTDQMIANMQIDLVLYEDRAEVENDDPISTPMALLGERLLKNEVRVSSDEVINKIVKTDVPEQVHFITFIVWSSWRFITNALMILTERVINLFRKLKEEGPEHLAVDPDIRITYSRMYIYTAVFLSETFRVGLGAFVPIFDELVFRMAYSNGDLMNDSPNGEIIWALPVPLLVSPFKLIKFSNHLQSQPFMGGVALSEKQTHIRSLLTILKVSPDAVTPDILSLPLAELLSVYIDSESKEDRKTIILDERVQKIVIPSICLCYIAAQKAGYYERMSARLMYTTLMEDCLNSEITLGASSKFYASLKNFCEQAGKDGDVFKRFIHHYVGSFTDAIEEGLQLLSEIKSRQDMGETEEAAIRKQQERRMQRARNRMQQEEREEEESDSEEDAIDVDGNYRQNVEAMSFVRLAELCRMYNNNGLSCMRILVHITKVASGFLANLKGTVDEVVLACNSCLDSLVGKKCLNLKVANKDSFHFKPVELLVNLVDCYINLCLDYDSVADDERDDIDANSVPPRQLVLHAILDEERYFAVTKVEKAYHICSRDHLISEEKLTQFTRVIELLKFEEQSRELEEKILREKASEIPTNYLDPIMSVIMRDPVLLPTSQTVMDRVTIEKHLMNEECDPYNRKPLSPSDLQSQDELRAEIESFIKNLLAKNS